MKGKSDEKEEKFGTLTSDLLRFYKTVTNNKVRYVTVVTRKTNLLHHGIE